jgi:hypothetical protein
MSSHPQPYSFPQRTPVFTAIVVIAAAMFCGWLINRWYDPAPAFNPRGAANPADFSEDQRWRMTAAGRLEALKDLQQKSLTAATSYGWVDQQKGIARIPIDRAIELTVRDHARK